MNIQDIIEYVNRGELPPIKQTKNNAQTLEEELSLEMLIEYVNRGELPPIIESKKDSGKTKQKVRTRKRCKLFKK